LRRKIIVGILPFLFAALVNAQTNEPLKLEKTIQLPDVQGRIDHMSIDVKGQRLFVSALGNNTVEVVDLKAGKRANTISGLKSRKVSFMSGCGRLYVASSKDGTVKIFDATQLKLLKLSNIVTTPTTFDTIPRANESMSDLETVFGRARQRREKDRRN